MNEILRAAWSRAHRYLLVAGRPKLYQSLWRGGRGSDWIARCARPDEHTETCR